MGILRDLEDVPGEDRIGILDHDGEGTIDIGNFSVANALNKNFKKNLFHY